MELLMSIVVGILLIEVYAWLPTLSEWLLARAIRQLPDEQQESCRDEWKAWLDDLPNTIVRVGNALSFYVRAKEIGADFLVGKLEDTDRVLKEITNKSSECRKKLSACTAERYRVRERLEAQLQEIALMKAPALAADLSTDRIKELWNSLDHFSRGLAAQTDRSWALVEPSVVNAYAMLDHVEALLKTASMNFRQILEHSQDGNESFDLIEKRLALIASDLEATESLLESDKWLDRDSLKAAQEIRTAVHHSIDNVARARLSALTMAQAASLQVSVPAS